VLIVHRRSYTKHPTYFRAEQEPVPRNYGKKAVNIDSNNIFCIQKTATHQDQATPSTSRNNLITVPFPQAVGVENVGLFHL
jgi:hypothetical protein